MVAVDVILGPLITFAVYNRRKAWRVLRRDLAVIAVFQLAALSYGLWTVYVARPVHLVFEYSRLAVVHAIDVPASLVPKMQIGLDAFPVWGPTPLSLRPFKDANEKLEATMTALKGLPLSARPDLWQPYAAALADIQKEAKPVAQLKSRFPARAPEIDELLAPFGPAGQYMVFLPMVGRKNFWTALLDPQTTEIKAFLPLDSY